MSNTPFKLGTFSASDTGATFAGVVVDGRVWAVSQLIPGLADDMLSVLAHWETNFARLSGAVSRDTFKSLESRPINQVHVHAPILYPRQIFCAGANYRQHVIDLVVDQNKSPETEDMTADQRRAWGAAMMDKRAATGTPYVFTKLPSAITGPSDQIVLPKDAEQPDWEMELVAVIGKPARRVSRADALSYVAGYTCANDVTIREKVHRADMKAIGSDWLAGKSAPTFLPMGPFMTPAAFVSDPQNLHITLKLNGNVMQDERTSDMLFNIARLIEYTSALVQMWPGDVLLTGSPKGNGTHFNRYLRPGDVMEGEISELGALHNPCVAEV